MNGTSRSIMTVKPSLITPALLIFANKVSQLELYPDYNFTGSAQYYTWDQLKNGQCVTFS